MKEPETHIEKKSYAVPLFLSGAVVGAVLGVLLAPGSGKETRRKVGTWLKEKGMKGKDEFLAGKEAMAAAVAAGKETFLAHKKEEKKQGVGAV